MQTVNNLVATWLSGEHTMFDACTEEPEIAWQAILEISKHDLTDEQKSLLAGGPLETLLTWHGALFIDRVENQAKVDSRFNYLLGGIWQQDISDEVWSRIQNMRKTVW